VAITTDNALQSGIVWGISLALFEDTHVDTRNGRIMRIDCKSKLSDRYS
jgi:CO/xanthine dehydrogenase Mo-binding subunit